MTLIETIKSHNLNARIQKLTAVSGLLTTLIGEAEMIGKNDGNRAPTDAEVQTLVRKFVKNNVETIGVLGDTDPRTAVLLAENFTLGKYLPKQMTTEELEQAIGTIKAELNAGPKDMGKVLQALKAKHDGLYDGKTASMIAKALLS